MCDCYTAMLTSCKVSFAPNTKNRTFLDCRNSAPLRHLSKEGDSVASLVIPIILLEFFFKNAPLALMGMFDHIDSILDI